MVCAAGASTGVVRWAYTLAHSKEHVPSKTSTTCPCSVLFCVCSLICLTRQSLPWRTYSHPARFRAHVCVCACVYPLQMNALARAWGATSTTFTNPHGMDAQPDPLSHRSTAADTARIAAKAMEDAVFRTVVRCRSYTASIQRHCHMEELERSLTRGISMHSCGEAALGRPGTDGSSNSISNSRVGAVAATPLSDGIRSSHSEQQQQQRATDENGRVVRPRSRSPRGHSAGSSSSGLGSAWLVDKRAYGAAMQRRGSLPGPGDDAASVTSYDDVVDSEVESDESSSSGSDSDSDGEVPPQPVAERSVLAPLPRPFKLTWANTNKLLGKHKGVDGIKTVRRRPCSGLVRERT